MTTDRCPACGAGVTPGAPWCTLCYADLRPAPAPAEPAIEPAIPPAIAVSLPSRAEEGRWDPLSAPLATLEGLSGTPALTPGVAPVATLTSAAPTWPCLACGARMAMSEDACIECGRPFLPSDTAPSLSLPGVGDVGRLDKMQRAMLTVGGVFGVMLLLLALAFLFGSVF